MAGFFQQFLKGVGAGFVDDMYLRDYQHASKIFRENAYANSPKYKWLFHVYFDINKSIAGVDQAEIFPSTTNYGVLVKTIDLPKYTLKVTELNQYNRKRLVQTGISYDPIRISFHDDNANQLRQLWFNYFSYYYNDPNQPNTTGQTSSTDPDQAISKLNQKNTYKSSIETDQNWGYLGEITSTDGSLNTSVNAKLSFFKSIYIYGFNQHNYALYVLINPLIENFTHDNYSYYDTRSTMENVMTLRYETVKYYNGALNGQKPEEVVKQFGSPNQYDTTLSPLNRPGTNRSILGQGGLLDAGSGIIEDLANHNYRDALQTAIRTGRTFRNGRQIINAAKSELVGEVIGNIEKAARIPTQYPAKGGVASAGQQVADRTNARNTQAPGLTTTQNNPANGITGPNRP